MLDGYYYCLNCHSEITPDYNEHCCFCGSAAVAVSGDYSPEEVETAFDLLNKQQQGIVVEVVHASWKWGYVCGQYGIYCTNCGAGWVDKGDAELIAYTHDYCPKCGAKMDGKVV